MRRQMINIDGCKHLIYEDTECFNSIYSNDFVFFKKFKLKIIEDVIEDKESLKGWIILKPNTKT